MVCPANVQLGWSGAIVLATCRRPLLPEHVPYLVLLSVLFCPFYVVTPTMDFPTQKSRRRS